jgi:hypothetical protein
LTGKTATKLNGIFADRFIRLALFRTFEIQVKLSDLFGLTIDELLRSDEELTKKVIEESKQLAHPKLKFTLDVLFLAALVLFAIKLGTLILNKVVGLDVTLPGGKFLWNFGPLILAIVTGIGSNMLKERYKQD